MSAIPVLTPAQAQQWAVAPPARDRPRTLSIVSRVIERVSIPGGVLLFLAGCSPQPPAVVPAASYPAGAPTQGVPSRVRAPTPEQLVLSYLGDRHQTVREAPHVVICTPGWEGRPREDGLRTPQRVIAKSFTVDTMCRVPSHSEGDTIDGVLLVRYSFELDTARVTATHVQAKWPQSWYEEYVWSNLRPVQNWSLRIWGFNPVNY